MLSPAAAFAQGTLDDVRREVYGQSENDRDERASALDQEDDHRDVYDDHYDLDDPSVVDALLWLLFSPSDGRADTRVHFYESEEARLQSQSRPALDPFRVQLSVTTAYLEPNLVQTQFSGALQLLSTLEVSGGYELFSERLEERTDRLGIGRLGIGLELGSPERGVRLVPAVHYLRFNDRSNVEGGAEVSARLEAFPGPVVLRLDGRTGVIGDATTRAVGVDVGWRFANVVELHVGWGGRVIGDVELLGPRGGLRLWL